jgi:DNA-3-methyladenine glycosylase
MMKNRKMDSLKNLTNGPGKLCAAMNITKKHYGIDMCENVLFLEESKDKEPFEMEATPRKNIDYAGEAKHYLWRYIIKGNKFVSK